MQSTRIVLGVVTILFIAVLGYAAFMHAYNSPATPTTQTTETASSQHSTTQTATSTTQTAESYTLADVAQHANASSCWTAINGSVYDVTNWINQHPGGPEAILSLCGKDGSAAFNGQHGGQRRPASELATFRIGALTQ